MKKLLLNSVGVLFALVSGTTLHATEIDKLQNEAKGKTAVTWYESSPSEQIDKVLIEFNKKFPDIKVRHTRLVGGNELAVRSVQEMQARGYTGDLLTGGADHMSMLKERGYLESVKWGKLGVPESYTPNSELVATTTSVYVAIWNTKKVAEADSPKTWSDVVDPKWNNRVGSWVRAASFAQLAATMGSDKAQRLLEEFVKNKPMLYKSTFPLAQAVGSGEVDMGIGFYHATLPPLKSGAPIAMRALDVVPMHMIYSGVSKNARNPEGAKILMAWLASDEGAIVYEDATGRGNAYSLKTKTAQLISGRETSEWPVEKAKELGMLNEAYNKILEAAGAAK